MMLTVDCPDEMFDAASLPSFMTNDGVLLEAVEDLPAGPWLAAVLAGIDRSSLSEHDLPVYLRAWGKLQAWTAAGLSDAVAEAGRPGGHGADKEVALALREPVGASQRRVHFTRRLRTMLPATRQLFRRGDLLEKHVDAIIDATNGVDDPELLAAVEDKVLGAPRALAKTARELRRDIRRVLTRMDPGGAQDRARAARDNADVTFLPGEDGTGTTFLDGPVEQALIVKTAADAAGATAKAAGDPRPIGVLKSEGLARICADYLTGRSTSGAAPTAGGWPIEIAIVIGLDTALGNRDLPGEVPGLGIVPREVIAQMVATELPKLRLLVVDEASGRLVYRATEGYRPTPEQVAHVRAAYVHSVGPGSQVLATRTDTDHAVPYPIGDTVIGNLLPNDRTWHNGHTRKQLSVTLDDDGTVTWTSVLGQTRTVTPYDYRLEPEASAPAEPSVEPVTDDPPPF